MELAKLIVSILAAAGLGGAIGAYFQTKFGFKAKISEKQQELKQKRYLCIIMLMLAKIDDEKSLYKLTQHRPDIKSVHDLNDELKIELLNATVYSCDDVLRSFSIFIEQPFHDSFLKVIAAIRVDLWGGKNKTISEDLKHILSNV